MPSSDHTPKPLYQPNLDHHDACGVGFIAARDLKPSFRITRLAVECLDRLDHRGARTADGTGDGAGILTQIPYRLLFREIERWGLRLPTPEQLGMAMVFLPPENPEEGERVVEEALSAESIRVLGWRNVPHDPAKLGTHARETLPVIKQAVVENPFPQDAEEFERRLLLARRQMEKNGSQLEGFTISSLSGRTVVYKGLFTASYIADFYWDLADSDFHTAFAIFHQRYSTNTSPSWANSQPFRTLAHNGEINTIRSNRSWMESRHNLATNSIWGDRITDLVPFLANDLSDSGSLDNAFELIIRSGRDLAHTKEMLIPVAWENVVDLSPEIRAFSEYQAFVTEPWDGPAAIAVTDGVSLLAAMDRNGLRPARWSITPNVVLVASEAGVCPVEEAGAERTGQLGPGDLLRFDGRTGEVAFGEEVRTRLAQRRPYQEWINTETYYIKQPFDHSIDDRFSAEKFARVFGYTEEERRLLLAPMAEGETPTSSMGNDTALAALSIEPLRLPTYFTQAFAQVTNPPMDPIREHLMMSLHSYLGARGSLLEETPQRARMIELTSPILSNAELERIVRSGNPNFFSHWIPVVWDRTKGPGEMKAAVEAVCDEAQEAVEQGATIIVLSDREVNAQQAPIPMLLAVGAVHHRLIERGVRLLASIVAVTGEMREDHDLACLLAYGASAVNPYLAIGQVQELCERGVVKTDSVTAQENYRKVLETGLLKIMSKMGICTISAYRGSELFEAIGLDPEFRELAFRNTPWRTSGRSITDLAQRVLKLHDRYEEGTEDIGGYFKHRRGGNHHITGPVVVRELQKAARSGDPADWQAYLETINDRPPIAIRDLLQFVDREPVPLEEVEPASHITRRFVTSAMSFGALSKEAHEDLAEAMNHLGGLSNSGEGGEDVERFGTRLNSAIKQVASGRFGVTPAYLMAAEELQIKMAQGSKPGEGGQLPGHKATKEIARLRHTKPGVTLISPPPHHDIYSIEDLAQLIYDLKAFKPSARVSVKLVSEPGVGTVAVGVAKAGADAILISGAEGGTGASPLTSIKHAGSPWELGLAEGHQVLTGSGMRSLVTLETDGGFRTGRDVVVAALLGAERYGFGTLPLLALGCKMVRQCHLNTCPTGIATQKANLRAKYVGSVDQLIAMFGLLAEEIRGYLAQLGARSLEDIIGRADLLEPNDHPMAAGLAEWLVRAEGGKTHPGYRKLPQTSLVERIETDAAPALERDEAVELSYPVNNTDRTVGAGLSGRITALYGSAGLPPGTVRIRLSGTAGQSFGAWLTNGIDLSLSGTANDYVGKGMGGGRIIISPHRGTDGEAPQVAGNAVLYGATGGVALLAGKVGQRFAVRNSGAVAVTEECSDHGCEYMTGGLVTILGSVGRNFAAGMTGGVAYVWDPGRTLIRFVADTAPERRRPDVEELAELKGWVEMFHANTDSHVAEMILGDWGNQSGRFWMLSPPVPVEEQKPEPLRIPQKVGS